MGNNASILPNVSTEIISLLHIRLHELYRGSYLSSLVYRNNGSATAGGLCTACINCLSGSESCLGFIPHWISKFQIVVSFASMVNEVFLPPTYLSVGMRIREVIMRRHSTQIPVTAGFVKPAVGKCQAPQSIYIKTSHNRMCTCRLELDHKSEPDKVIWSALTVSRPAPPDKASAFCKANDRMLSSVCPKVCIRTQCHTG